MTTVLALAALNAENFESGSATEGQVLTADGSGGAAFEDAPNGLPDYSSQPTGKVLRLSEKMLSRGVGIVVPSWQDVFEVPSIDGVDNGHVLTVVEGNWGLPSSAQWAAPSIEIPDTWHIYNSAIITPGDYIEGTGSREVTIELFNSFNPPATNGKPVWLTLALSNSPDLTTFGSRWRFGGDASSWVTPQDVSSNRWSATALVYEVNGQVRFTTTITDSTGVGGDTYLVLMLPSGQVLSEAITIPATGK